MRENIRSIFAQGNANLAKAKSILFGAVEKGFERAKLSRVEIATNLDLSAVPNYVAYKAALIREKTLLQHVSVGLGLAVVLVFIVGRLEVSKLEGKLRTKEFILAPGVVDFIPVSPQSVPDSYVQHAVSDFISTLGNTNPANIEERYKQLSSVMSQSLQVQFGTESGEWIAKAKAENVSEMATVLEKRIESDDGGRYRVTAYVRIDSFVGSESIGYRNEVIEMGLRLVPPDVGRRWFLEITSLSRTSAEAFQTAKKLGGAKHGK